MSQVPVGAPRVSGEKYDQISPLFQNERTVAFRARRTSDGHPVVLKCVAPRSTDRRARWRLRHEHRILMGLEHPGVMRSHGIDQTSLGPALVLDFMGEATLDLTACRTGAPPLSLEHFLDLAIHLAQMVAILHDAGVTHRDINPRNIVHDPDTGGVWLIDFGLATRLSRETREVTRVQQLEGTLGYLSPEQTGRMNRPVDWRTDLYSLGITLYELLVGRLPFTSDEPLETLHATVARLPPAPHELRADVPLVLSSILLCLLSKDAEERYQNARALANDLESCLDQLGRTGAIAPFTLRVSDRRGVFVVPGRLYGFTASVGVLETALQHAREGERAVVGIEGEPGVGKTALTRELLPRLSNGGRLADGVCNPLERLPYAPIVQVLRCLVKDIEPEGEDPRGLRGRFIAAVGDDGGLLKRVLPELEDLVGPVPDAIDVGAVEGRDRMLALLVRLVRDTHHPEAPLVVFLDDLQWADVGTLAVLEQLLDPALTGGPLLLLAWRDKEVGAGHSLRHVLPDDLETVHLLPLSQENIAQLLADTMSMSTDDTRSLAALVYAKTAGNAFFVHELLGVLVAQGLIYFEPEDLRWSWSLEGIEDLPPTSNVAELLAESLREAEPDFRLMLGTAACLGKRFDLATLSSVWGRGLAETASEVWEAVNAQLLVPLDDTWGLLEAWSAGVEPTDGGEARLRFVHDEVFEFACGLLPTAERAQAHLETGRLFRSAWEQGLRSPFEAADHLYAARDLITDPGERLGVAAVHLSAGRQAYTSAAYLAALQYFEGGLVFLDEASWDADHELTFRLHVCAAETHLMCPGHEGSVDFRAVAMARARDVLERVEVQRVQILYHMGRYEFAETVELTIEALSWVGVKVSASANMGHVAVALLRTSLKLRGRGLDDLRALPVCTDPRVDAAMKLLADTATVAYYTNAFLLPVLLTRMVDLSLDHGVSDTTAFGFAGMAFLQIVTRDDVARAWELSVFAREVLARFDAKRLAPKVELLVIGFVEARRQGLRSLVDAFQAASWLAKKVGDAEYTGLHAMNHTSFSFLGGVDLEQTASRARTDLQTCVDMSQEQSTNNMLITMQVMDCLRGLAPDPARMSGEHTDFDTLLARMEDKGDKSGIALIRMMQVQLSLLFADTDTLLGDVDAAAACLGDLPGAPHVPPFIFHGALACVRSLRESGQSGGRRLRQARKWQKRLAKMAEDGPLNFAHKAKLVEAELLELEGKAMAAQLAYEAAIDLARVSGMVQEEALALECAAHAALRLGNTRLAASLAIEARSAWLGWGAAAREPAMNALLAHFPNQGTTPGTWISFDRTISAHELGAFDMASVVKASRALSGEIHFEALLRKLMYIILESAGATWCMLLLPQDGGLVVAAWATVDKPDAVQVKVFAPGDRQLPADVRPHSAKLVAAVARVQKTEVIGDATVDTRFFGDAADPPLSVLCVPVSKGGELMGVIYLENELARSAFTPDRHEVVGVLCSQAAVSIENAALYTDLQEALRRQRQITRSFERFVPKQFLQQLGRTSILDVALGDQVQQDIAILFMDIRGFTTLSEQLTPAATFSLVNMLLATLGPIVRQHNGFIDKYIGDAIMALFPGSSDDAVHACLGIQRAVAAVRSTSSGGPRSQLRVGVGVHRGPTMLGTIGEAERMDSTVLSDAVNVAARLEGLTKEVGANILVSEDVRSSLEDPTAFSLRALGTVPVKGKRSRVYVHEVLDVASNQGDQAKLDSLASFAEGVALLEGGDHAAARICFAEVLARNPSDPAALVLMQRAISGRH